LDGVEPQGRLIDVGGVLYGTTNAGGQYNFGTVYKITTSGTETVLHSFKGPPDGQWPESHLVNVDGALYGTTLAGGAGGGGTGSILRITTSGAERIIHSFSGSDGSTPFGGLTNVNGTLYGSTSGGGISGGHGTVFSLTL
jgi:uncharacterized repeat protein (TIGR03803 family)